MTALCGTWHPDALVTEDDLHRSLASMSRRGGTTQDIYSSSQFAFGLLRERPLGDHSGLYFDDQQTVSVAFDGIIFNEAQLVKDHLPNPAADILPALYHQLGSDSLALLDGSFAIAIWDKTQDLVLLARDHLGSKPLFYCSGPNGLAFGSEIPAILQLTKLSPALNIDSVDTYLRHLFVPAPNTLLQDVFQVAPGQVCTFRAGKLVDNRSYLRWERDRLDGDNIRSLSTTLRDLLAKAVVRRVDKRSDVGFLLSGGLDTGTVVGCAATVSPHPIKTYTIGFPDCPEVDERRMARTTAEYFRTDHHELEATSSCIDALPEVTRFHGAPVLPSALIFFEALSQIGSGINAIVTGDGGDEIFCDKSIYEDMMRFVLNLHEHPNNGAQAGEAGKLRSASGFIHAFLDDPYDYCGTKLGHVVRECTGIWQGLRNVRHIRSYLEHYRDVESRQFQQVVDHYQHSYSCWGNANLTSLYSKDMQQATVDYRASDYLAGLFRKDELPTLQQLIRVYSSSYTPYLSIGNTEVGSVCNGLFPLAPILDKEVMRFMYRVPFEHVYGRSKRYIMKKAFAKHVIPAELFRRPHRAIDSPSARWMRTPKWKEVIHEYLSPQRLTARGLFSADYVQKIVADFYAGNNQLAINGSKAKPLSTSIWSLVALEAWCEQYL